MNILVTGAKGQLGVELQKLSPNYKNYTFYYTDVDTLDITNYKNVEAFIKKNKPQVLINCAAYTAVDKAESEKALVYNINTHAVKHFAEMSAKYNFVLVHISTDYVFDGQNHKPYTENDTANPKSVYGKSKYEAEIEIIFNTKKAVIIRTSWLYAAHGHNFMNTILRLAKEKELLTVVADQIGTPTYAGDLAKAILDALPSIEKTKSVDIYNYANEGIASWFDFAKAIITEANISCKVKPIESKDFRTDAARPFYSVLNKTKFKNTFKQEIPYWKDSLAHCIRILKEDKQK